jgi:hypothetical protein
MGLGQFIIIFLLSTSKFLLGVIGAMAADITWLEAVSITTFGGIFGVVFYLFTFEYIIAIIQKRAKNIKIKFSKWRRFMIHLKQKGGLLGIALLTPLILSIPLGIALSISLGSSKKRILIFHCLSILGWSLLIFTLKFNFGFDPIKLLFN